MPSTRKTKRNHRRNSLQLFLGIDGGGTKTHAVLLDYKGDFVGEGFSGASNPLRVGIEMAVTNIFHAAESACDAANRILDDILAVQCGLAGASQLHAALELFERFIERQIAGLQLVHDGFQLRKGALEVGGVRGGVRGLRKPIDGIR